MWYHLTTVTASQTLCWHPKGISCGHFSIAMKKYARVAIEDFTNKIDHRTNTYKRRLETMKGKSQIAIDMVKRAVKELREHFGFGKEENRIYEALIDRITLSFFIVSCINRISNEPKTIGGLFKDLECELHTLAIAMQVFITILDEIAKIEDIVNRNEDLVSIIAVLQDVTQKMLGFRCES